MADHEAADAWLEVWRPAGHQTVPLSGAKVRIGKAAANNDVVIAEDPTLSRKHAVIERAADEDAWVLRDLGSRNGTFVNGKRVTTHPLAHGDQITMGGTKAVFETVTVTSQSTIVAAPAQLKLNHRDRRVLAALCRLLADEASDHVDVDRLAERLGTSSIDLLVELRDLAHRFGIDGAGDAVWVELGTKALQQGVVRVAQLKSDP